MLVLFFSFNITLYNGFSIFGWFFLFFSWSCNAYVKFDVLDKLKNFNRKKRLTKIHFFHLFFMKRSYYNLKDLLEINRIKQKVASILIKVTDKWNRYLHIDILDVH